MFLTLRPFFVRYPATWTGPLAVVAAAVFGWSMVMLQRRGMATMRTITEGAGTTAVACLSASLPGTIAWLIIVSIRSTPAAFESYLYFLLFLVIGGMTVLRVAARSRARNLTSFAAGVVLFWVVLAVATGFSLPGFSYLFLWPALAGSLVVLANTFGYRTAQLPRFIIVAAPAVVLLTPAIDTFFQMAQPRPGNPDSEIAFAVFAPLLLAFLVGALSWVARRDPNPQLDQSA